MDLKESSEVVELKLSESNIELATKANSYNGFGLYVNGTITASDDTKIDLSITIRHDFRLFNLIFSIGLLIALFYDKAQINDQVMDFEERVPYIFLGFLTLLIFDLIFLSIPWIRLKQQLSKKLNLKK